MLENYLFTSNQNGRNVSERNYSVTEKLKVMRCIQRLLICFISIDTKQVKQQKYIAKRYPLKSFTVPSKT